MKTYTISGYVETPLVLTVRAKSKKEDAGKSRASGHPGALPSMRRGLLRGRVEPVRWTGRMDPHHAYH